MSKRFSPENYFGNLMGIPSHDYVINSYTGSNLTQTIYKRGGATGTIVATIVRTYDGNNNLLTVERTV